MFRIAIIALAITLAILSITRESNSGVFTLIAQSAHDARTFQRKCLNQEQPHSITIRVPRPDEEHFATLTCTPLKETQYEEDLPQ